MKSKNDQRQVEKNTEDDAVSELLMMWLCGLFFISMALLYAAWGRLINDGRIIIGMTALIAGVVINPVVIYIINNVYKRTFKNWQGLVLCAVIIFFGNKLEDFVLLSNAKANGYSSYQEQLDANAQAEAMAEAKAKGFSSPKEQSDANKQGFTTKAELDQAIAAAAEITGNLPDRPALNSLFDATISKSQREQMARDYVVGKYHYANRNYNYPQQVVNLRFNQDGTMSLEECRIFGEVSERYFDLTKHGKWSLKERRYADTGEIYYSIYMDIGMPQLTDPRYGDIMITRNKYNSDNTGMVRYMLEDSYYIETGHTRVCE